jgi:hypothetical protein
MNGYLRIPLVHCPKLLPFRYLQSLREAILDRFLPIGYEDETGFHYGREEDGF